MREGIHPQYVESTVTCACGYTFKTRSTKPMIKLEICANCHPFFTSKEKLVDTAGRIEKLKKKLSVAKEKPEKPEKPKEKIKRQVPEKIKTKILSTSTKRKKSS